MENIYDSHKKEEPCMEFHQKEQMILVHVARLLVEEKLINPREQLRFLAFLKEEV